MSENFTLEAEVRNDNGKGASRRLRHAGRVPGIIYGGNSEPQAVSLNQNEFRHHLENEAFYSHILTVNVDGKGEQVILKDLQRHPAKPIILHFDLLRVLADEDINVNVPLHFIGEAGAVGVKAGGRIQHNMTDVEVICLPGNLPEYIEVQVQDVALGETVHLTDLVLPEGVKLAAFAHGGEVAEHDLPVLSIVEPKGGADADDEDGEGEAAEGEGDAE